jgi:hypothetical protein
MNFFTLIILTETALLALLLVLGWVRSRKITKESVFATWDHFRRGIGAIVAWMAITYYGYQYGRTHDSWWIMLLSSVAFTAPFVVARMRSHREDMIDAYVAADPDEATKLRAYDDWEAWLASFEKDCAIDLAKNKEARDRLIATVEADVLFNRNYLANIAALPATPEEARLAVANSEACLSHLKNLAEIRAADALQQNLEASTAPAAGASKRIGRL